MIFESSFKDLSSREINGRIFPKDQCDSQMDRFPAIEKTLGEGNYLASCVASTLDSYNTIIKLMKSRWTPMDCGEREAEGT